MADSILGSVHRLKSALAVQGPLSLWEVRAILGEDRDHVKRVLNLLSAESSIAFVREHDELCVALR